MKNNLLFYITSLMLMVFNLSLAQLTIKGTVSDDEGIPLPGATVVVQNTSNGVSTDFDGLYTITANTGDVLVFSFVGYTDQTVTVGSSDQIDVVLTSDNELEEVIVVAYGTSSLEAFTGSASVIRSTELSKRNVTSPIAAIEGKATGVQFTSPSGQPGSSPGIVIRGVGTLNGDTTPLFIVDGIQYEGALSTINQEDISSFTILKDAASTSLYGSRAANGVILITTKSGSKTGGITTNFSAQTGIVERGVDNYDYVSPAQYYEIMWEALKNTSAGGGDPIYASNNIFNSVGYNPFNVANDQIVGTDGRINPNASVIYKSLNWYDVLEQNAMRSNYNLNVAGGGENHRVFLSASYLEEEGYIISAGYDRLTTRLNADFDVNDKITIGGSANITISESVGPSSAGSGSIVNPFGFAKGIGSVYPVYVNDQQGNLVLDAGGNPVFDNGSGYPDYGLGSRPRNQGRHALQELTLNDERNKVNTYGFRSFADFKLYEGLSFRVNYGRDINEGLTKEYENNLIGDADPTGRYYEERYRREVETFNQIISYSNSFSDIHNVDITAGHESFSRQFSGIYGRAISQTAEGIYEFDNFASVITLGGSTTNKRIEGYFLRTNYNFDNKYFFSASVRRDASSVFSADARWGNFYSAGFAWRIDKESFMEDLTWIDKLKIRGSYGEVGNDDLNDFFISQARYGLSSNAGDPAIVWDDIGNSALQWETQETFDIAVEFGLFNGLIDGQIEYYKKNSTDLLYDLPIAPSNGLSSYPANVADMYNSGWEIALNSRLVKNADFSWDLSLQGSTFKNEITSLPDPFVSGSKRWEEGRSRFDYYILHTAGVDPANGDQLFLMFELDADGNTVPVLDTDGTQLTTNDWEATERAYTGDNSIPDLLGSISNNLSYKGFSLDILVTFGIGGKILDNAYSSMLHSGTYGASLHPDIMNAWRQPGDITTVPRMQSGSQDLVRSASTRFLTDASFWSLKNINLGYSLNSSVVEKLGLDSLTLSLTGENLFIKSERTGLNPQFNISGVSSGIEFKPSRIFSLGINVSL
ncbi:SusC/RagA family TonB-linked outer membrane protein [Flavobacteriaceae bacterium]|nr:SusC/RagA family TonB-linked outer membrane protein [Flavobacteriaceae bacterium]MDA9984350.1 SusC/RagA family TonB-linked outer membrane protein [Flavobacteriaceae bacterium]